MGGPLGEHAAPHRWWTPVRVVLALTAVCFALGMLQKAPCYHDSWLDGQERYSQMCYSDLPYLYVGRGFAELNWPYDGDDETRARYEVMEYPVGISYSAWGTAWLTHWVTGSPDVDARASVPQGDLYGDPQVVRELRTYVAVNAVHARRRQPAGRLVPGPGPSRTGPGTPRSSRCLRRCWSPGWSTGTCSRWRPWPGRCGRGRATGRCSPGVLIGLGTATKLYPLFLLGGVLVICLRRRDLPTLLRVTVSAPAGPGCSPTRRRTSAGRAEWKVFWTFNSERGADLGSLWLVVQQAGPRGQPAQHQHGLVGVLRCLVPGASSRSALLAPETPRLAQLGFLVVAGFLLVNKVYSPQYVLWLLPLAVLARPRWRDQLIWQAGELLYFASVWWYLGGYLAPGGGSEPGFYWLAVIVRMAAELYLVAIVTRDVLRPLHDPVEPRVRRGVTRSNVVAV